jgi:PKD repeat protein
VVGSEVFGIVIDQVRYNDKAPWPVEPDGLGASLERVVAQEYGNDPVNWAASLGDGGTPGAPNSVSSPDFNRPPVPGFDASPVRGLAPLVVAFDASSSFDPDGDIAAFEWNFGDGGIATGRTISHTYNSVGTYIATLKVADNRGLERSVSRSIVVEEPANNPPVVAFEISAAAGRAPFLVQFDASGSFDPDGEIAEYQWTFGDGNSGIGKTISHTYTAAGNFTATLKVSDNKGLARSASKVIQVTPGGGGQIPGDCTQDGIHDISDAICLLGHLFLGSPVLLPCEGGTAADAGNLALLDSNGDSAADISDAVHNLTYLFLGGPPPKLGTACTRIQGCPDLCQ